MFRRRPTLTKGTAQDLITDDFAHGHCFLARQEALVFGSNRKIPVTWRHTVSLRRVDNRLTVFPATTDPDRRFFHIEAGQCFLKRAPRAAPRDSYLCPAFEAVLCDEAIEIGIFDHPIRIQIAKWLQEYFLQNNR